MHSTMIPQTTHISSTWVLAYKFDHNMGYMNRVTYRSINISIIKYPIASHYSSLNKIFTIKTYYMYGHNHIGV
jgi:hypothetical protein